MFKKLLALIHCDHTGVVLLTVVTVLTVTVLCVKHPICKTNKIPCAYLLFYSTTINENTHLFNDLTTLFFSPSVKSALSSKILLKCFYTVNTLSTFVDICIYRVKSLNEQVL